jgi:hypothetical protein
MVYGVIVLEMAFLKVAHACLQAEERQKTGRRQAEDRQKTGRRQAEDRQKTRVYAQCNNSVTTVYP